MKQTGLVLATAWTVALASPAGAQTGSAVDFAEAADAHIAALMEGMPSVPGVAISVVQGDSVVYRRTVGWADVEAGAELTPRTSLYIASNTKSFTALAAALLHERGDLDLDAPITRYLSREWFPPGIDADAVTLRHLLTHTSGLSNDALVFRTAYSGEHTPHELRRLLGATIAREDAPLGTFEYTNTGYIMAAMVMEAATGTPWQELLRREIFEPLGMADATARRSELAPGTIVAAPYRGFERGGRVRIPLEKTDRTLHPAGGILATLPDLERWLMASLDADGLAAAAGVSADALKATHSLQAPAAGSVGPLGRDGYGLGWIVGSFAGQPLIYHTGDFPGAGSFISFMPERDLGVVVFSNEDRVGVRVALLLSAFTYDWWLDGGAAEELAGFAASLVERLEGPAPAAPVQVDPDRVRQLAGIYHSDAYGTLYVGPGAHGTLELRVGDQVAAATGFSNDTATVAFLPGRPDEWVFELEGGRVRRVLYGDWGTFVPMAPAPSRAERP